MKDSNPPSSYLSAQKNHINEIVDIHLESLADDFLPQLGKTVLTTYYNAFIVHNPIIIVKMENKVVGFAALGIHPIDIRSLFLRHYKQIICTLLRKPFLWGQAVWLAVPRKHATIYPEIQFIAVQKRYRGLSLGSNLIAHTQRCLSERNQTYLQVKTHDTNTLTNHFYQKNGFVVTGKEKRCNKTFHIYSKKIDE
ncbi:MAG: N-acetyltransferase [Desulfobacteraceae bacterium]|nr:MAG: N-acetyltransferase [Desulfobacteraceae bacterium]